MNRALVVSLDDDATTHAAISEAIEAVTAAGLAPCFKLAMVAEFPRTFSVYQSAERIAAKHRIAARAFRTRSEAVQWLTGQKSGERAASRS